MTEELRAEGASVTWKAMDPRQRREFLDSGAQRWLRARDVIYPRSMIGDQGPWPTLRPCPECGRLECLRGAFFAHFYDDWNENAGGRGFVETIPDIANRIPHRRWVEGTTPLSRLREPRAFVESTLREARTPASRMPWRDGDVDWATGAALDKLAAVYGIFRKATASTKLEPDIAFRKRVRALRSLPDVRANS